MAICEFARYCATSLDAIVSIENPDRSYLWLLDPYLELIEEGWTETRFSPCMYGADYPKYTKLLCWRRCPKSMGRLCVRQPSTGEFSCGHGPSRPHCVLEGRRCSAAAEYADGVVEAWARDVYDWRLGPEAER